MADVFVLNYLLNTLEVDGGAERWKTFKAKQLEEIDLAQADLENRNLRGYDLREINLSGGRLYNANLVGSDLRGAQLTYADMRKADLSRAFLADANLAGANLELATAVETNFENALMRGCKMRGAQLNGARLRGADLQKADLRGANLKSADLTGALVNEIRAEDAILADCKFDGETAKYFQRFKAPSGAAIGRGNGTATRARQAPAGDLSDTSSEEGCCKILGVELDAAMEEITKAYRKKVLKYHPDRVFHLDDAAKTKAQTEFDRVQKAYEFLSKERAKPASAKDQSAAKVTPSAVRKSSKDLSLYELLELAKANPNNDRVFYNLGLKYYEQGMLERAIEAYERALKLNPANKFAERGLKITNLSLTLRDKKGN